MIRAIRVELAKPLNCSWDELGTILRDQRTAMHRLLNAAILRCVLAHRTKESGAIQTLAYQEVELELERYREWARQELERLRKKRSKKKKDLGEELISELDRERYVQSFVRKSSLELSGGSKAAISSAAYDQFNKWIKSKGELRLPSFKKGAPIFIRGQEFNLLEDEQGRAILEVKLTAGRTGRHRIALRASKGRHWQQLRDLTQAKVKRGDLKIVYDEDRKKWYGIVSFHEDDPAPLTVDPKRALIVHRGVRNFLYVISTTGQAQPLLRGGKLVAQKRKLEARRRDLRMVSVAERGSGAKGHGRVRRFESYEALGDKLANIIKTTCQQAAARVAQLAKQGGYGMIVIEEYGGIAPDEDRALRRFVQRFPLYQLKQAIAWVCKKNGLSLVEVPAQYISTTCPACSSNHLSQHNHRTGVFHCMQCDFDRPADFVAALNMLRDAPVDASWWDNRLKQTKQLAEGE